MAPFEALYGRKCRSTVVELNRWKKLLWPKLITRTVDKVAQIRKHLQAVQDHQWNWADSKRRPLGLWLEIMRSLKYHQLGVLLDLGVKGSWVQGKLGHLRLWRIDSVAYRLALPPCFEGVHDVFHVSQLWKYMPDEKHIHDYSELTLRSDLT